MSLTKAPKRRRFFGGDDRTRELPAGSLPCRACGVAVTTYVDTPVETLTIFGQRNGLGFGTDIEIPVTRCDACAARRDNATAIMLAHPAVAREHGSVGVDRLDGALAALDVLGRGSLTGILTSTDGQLRGLIAALSALGGWASWSATSAAPGVCGSRRWGHVSNEIWEDTRREFAELLRRRVERPKPIAPPSDRGALPACAFCGIGTVLVKDHEARAAWGVERQMPLASMGGRGGEVVIAHVCPACRAALLASGDVIGQPAVWLAVIRFRGYVPRSSAGVVSLSGVRPWAALPRGTEPNTVPWAHLDMRAVDRALLTSTYVRRADQPPLSTIYLRIESTS